MRHDDPTGALSGKTHSGRLFVVGACLTILVLWGSLQLGFREWRARYLARANYGASQVAPAIDPLTQIVPPGVDPSNWRGAVRQTHDLLVTVTGANLLDLPQMQTLCGELDRAVERAMARPETARDELAAVWDSIDERAGFVHRDGRSASGVRHPRPAILASPPERRSSNTRSSPYE